ncbi:MAG: hypothetical protein ACOX3T_04180 [Bdellovibrionota bacterium]
MESILINGQAWEAPVQNSLKMTELVELVKSSIDPSQIITGILLNGKDLEDSDWNGYVSMESTDILEIETDTVENYIEDRISVCPNIITQCYLQFRRARKLFQNGESFDANNKLVEAVQALKSFFDWYSTLLALMTEAQKEKYDIEEYANRIYETCKKICQQQLYQSWWELGELLEKELEPTLDELEDVLINNAKGN